MNTERETNEGLSPGERSRPAPLPAGAAERRRLLLKGVGRGGAILAAAAPLKTLATQRLLTSDSSHVCTVSGMQSSVLSASPGSTVCSGFTPSYFGQSKDASNSKPSNPWPTLPNGYTYATPCKTVFTRCNYPANPSLFQVLNQQIYSKYDEPHWVCAWLNALQGGALNFPYTPDQVITYYCNNDSNALSFFKGYMETRAV